MGAVVTCEFFAHAICCLTGKRKKPAESFGEKLQHMNRCLEMMLACSKEAGLFL